MSKTDFIEYLLSCSPLFSFLSLYILDSFPHQGRDTRREESRQQFVQSFLERQKCQLNMTCDFNFHAMLKGVYDGLFILDTDYYEAVFAESHLFLMTQ